MSDRVPQRSPRNAPQKSRGMAEENVLGKAYDAQLMKRLWGFVAPHWRMLLLSLALIPIAVGFELIQPLLLQVAIDQYLEPGVLSGPGLIEIPPFSFEIQGLAYIAVAYMIIVALWALAQYAQLYTIQLLGQRSMHDLRIDLYRHVIGQRSGFFDRMPVGRLLTRMTNDVESINEMFASGVITLIADLFKLIAIVVAMLLLNVELTLMTFLVMPLLIVVVAYARRIMRESFRAVRVKLAAMNSFAQEHLSGIKVVQLFARERTALGEYNDINDDYRTAYHGVIRADAAMYALVEAISVVSIASIAWYASGKLGVVTADDANPLTIGLVVAFVEYVRKFFIPVRDFSAKYTVMQGAMAAAERIMDLLDDDEPDAIALDDRAAAKNAGRPLSRRPAEQSGQQSGASRDDGHMVSFRDVHFAYREDEPVLRGVSFDIPRGQTVAVVGTTGSGKSTLIKLLARLYEIDEGTIELGGEDIRDMLARDLRRRVTVVSQDVFLFSGTVMENVKLGNPDASAEIIKDAMDRVGASRMLDRRLEKENQADGEETTDPMTIEIAERGGNFSAGERQLLAFARALARDPEVLVLDEATAHVDPEAEALIEQGVAELMRGRTTLVIAHRLSTIRNADQIVVMSRGAIVERGTHDELVARGGIYAKLERTFSRAD